MSQTPFDNPARRAAVKIVRRLRDKGHLAYLAGGCVRDELLGLVPKDYDVATEADPETVRSLFRFSRFVGEAFGVVLIRIRSDEVDPHTGKKPMHQIEVATFRTEWGYTDGRRPSEVQFTDAEHDAQRRDFTINGLFEDPLVESNQANHADSIIDFVGGVADLEKGVLRAIGNPDERFGEDYLRMLRAVRFAARFGFELEAKTVDAIRTHAPKLAQISRERVGTEVLATLDGPQPATGIQLIESLGLDGAVLDEPQQACTLHTVNALSQQVSTTASPRNISPAAWLSAWLLDRHVFAAPNEPHATDATLDITHLATAIDKLAPARGGKVLSRWRNALCLPNDLRDALRDNLVSLSAALNWQAMDIAQRKRLLARTSWHDASMLIRAMAWLPACEQLAATIDAEAAPLIEQGVAPPRFLTGDDLITMGIKPGKQLGLLLEAVYDEQLASRVTTREQAVMWVEEHK